MTKKICLFLAAVGIQTLIVVAVPAKQIHARLTGREIKIKTAPADPYDFLSGYHVILRYQISQVPQDSSFPYEYRPKPVYVVLKEDNDKIWTIDSLQHKRPADISESGVVIKGKARYGRIEYGIEHFFIPENKRQSIEYDLRNNRDNTYAYIRVDRFGNAALMRLLIGDQTYEY